MATTRAALTDNDIRMLVKGATADEIKKAHAGFPCCVSIRANRRVTARSCAANCSARASVAASGPMARRPSRETSCTVMDFWKLATESPLHARAAPCVGNT